MGDNELEWDTTERDAWVEDAERWLRRINGVRECKIDLDGDGAISGVHVVAGMEREPRHIVRDVEGLLKARLGLDVYYKKIGVVQMVDELPAGAETEDEVLPVPGLAGPLAEVDFEALTRAPGGSAPGAAPADRPAARGPEPASSATASSSKASLAAAPTPAVLVAEDLAPRLQCAGVGVMTSETLVRAEVRLQAGDLVALGTREVPNHAGSDVVAVAEAALAAVGELLADPVLLHLNEIRTESMGGNAVVLVAVDLVEGRRSETLFGTCGAGHNRQQAIVFAVLDALNRRLALHALKPTGAADA
ncbi:MAG: hypothetical protein IH621_02190 [Krumholzibacteria bacterium]|nr:hypothetical protein [Candidatus Krumholzibacteria bacterium]